MKSEDYIDRITSRIHDDELRARLKEELGEHWEDHCEHAQEEQMPENVLGDESLVVRQTNAVTARDAIGKDVALSVLCGVVTLVIGMLLSTFFFGDVDTPEQWVPAVIASAVGASLWCGVAWYVYLAFHRRVFVRHGQSLARAFMLTLVIGVPIAYILIQSIMTLIHRIAFDSPAGAMWQFIAETLSTLILCGLFISAGRLVTRTPARADQILVRFRRGAPFVLSFVLLAGITFLLASDSANTPRNEVLALVGLPFMLPVLVLYLLWGALTVSIGSLGMLIGIPFIYGYWVTVLAALVLGFGIPLFQLVSRRTIGTPFRFFASIVVPLVILLPTIPSDVPQIDWEVPVVWSWDDLERRQLNVVYPWAASLMRRDEGMNVAYAAYQNNGTLVVVQGGGNRFELLEGGVKNIGRDSDLEQRLQENPYAVQGELPEGFACAGTSLEALSDTHSGSTGPLGMFGVACPTLTYRGNLVASIAHGALIDLDLTDAGFLAVSINMGSYDPTYVYVVDVGDLDDETLEQ